MRFSTIRIDEEQWVLAATRLAAGEVSLVGLWGEAGFAHMALIERASSAFSVLTLACSHGRFPSVAKFHPPAMRLERAMRDLHALEPVGLPDTRPWLRHDAPYAFLAAEGESLHQVAVGPVHAGIIEPGHFRFTANGETVVRLEQRLGYVHKGIEALMAGAPLERAARLAGRVSGDSTVAFALAFAHAVEAASDWQPPARAVWLRALMAELERLANHLGDIGAVCNDAAFVMLHAQFGWLREQVLRAGENCFGHRLMMDRIVPGGVATDLSPSGDATLRALVELLRGRLPDLVEVYDNTESLKDRTVATGVVAPALAAQFAAGGFVGRASARSFDARRTPGYAPYADLKFEVPSVQAGDVNARVWIRIREVEESLSLVEQLLDALPSGALHAAVPAPLTGEGAALVEGFRGDVFAWVRLAGGAVERCHLRDPSWFQWPLLEAAIEGNIIADFPLCNKSFNCSYAGHDL